MPISQERAKDREGDKMVNHRGLVTFNISDSAEFVRIVETAQLPDVLSLSLSLYLTLMHLSLSVSPYTFIYKQVFAQRFTPSSHSSSRVNSGSLSPVPFARRCCIEFGAAQAYTRGYREWAWVSLETKSLITTERLCMYGKIYRCID